MAHCWSHMQSWDFFCEAFPWKVMKTATLHVFLSCDFAVTGLWNGARSLEKLKNGKRTIGNLSLVKFRCKLPSPYSIFGIQKPGMFSRPVGWGYDLDKQMKKQSPYYNSQSSPFKVRTMRKHTGKTPLSLGLLLNLFIKQILTLVWSTDFGNSQIPNCLHIAYAFEHTTGQQINLFSIQWMIFWFWKDVAKKLDLVTQQNKLLQFTKQFLWQCQEVRANYEGASISYPRCIRVNGGKSSK